MQAPGPTDALLVVDVQNDFLPDGALGIHRGDAIIAPLNQLLSAWRERGLPVFLSRGWHPAAHCSFAAQGGPWPEYCVAGTRGAEFPERLAVAPSSLERSRELRHPQPVEPQISVGLRAAAERSDGEFP
jgi:nicotinamidase/pyrazinamidase